MAYKIFIFLLSTAVTTQSFPSVNTDIITEPKPGQEYVFVQTSSINARPITRKEKPTQQEVQFETAHKFPPSLTYALEHYDESEDKATKGGKKVIKRDAPAPPGATKIDVKALLAKYNIATSTVKPQPTSTKAATTPKSSRKRGTKRRVKKEVSDSFEVTSPKPVLTTAKSVPRVVDSDDIPLAGAASEKQRSRIQIKKGPNGQEYEYEYVYYYYDDEDDPKNKKVSNSHDGPARNQIPSRSDLSREKPIPEVNEVLPVRGNKIRGRQLGEDDTVVDERLPVVTRFPPRSRNLNTTPVPVPEEDLHSTRGRVRGRPSTESTPNVSEADNVSDETQGSRGRTRANIRRPSLDLVDSDSFNNHGNSQSKPSFPQELPEGPKDDPEEAIEPVYRPREELPPSPSRSELPENEKVGTTVSSTEDATTAMSPMDKVALDLYAISQGTQKLFGEGAEDGEISTERESKTTDQTDLTTEESSTVPETTPTTTTTTTTTTSTTTTTTPPPPPSTEPPPQSGRGKFGAGRRGLNGRKSTAQTSTTEATPTETKKGKFGRPSFGGRSRSRTTAAPAVEEEVHKEEAKPASHSKPSRSRFGGSRPRSRTTAAPEESKEDSSSTSAPSTKVSLPRSRPSFNSRPRGRTTAAPSTEQEEPNEESSASTAEASSTVRSRRINGGSAVRPLRPGARLNLGGRGRGITTSTTEAPAEDHVTGDEEPETHEQEASEKEETPAPVDNNPLNRLRNKNRLNVQSRPKAAASSPVHVRRVNPLLGRKRPGQSTEAPSSEAPHESSTEEAETAETAETEPVAPSSSTTTEEPKGLNKLLAGRRRLGARVPGTLSNRT